MMRCGPPLPEVEETEPEVNYLELPGGVRLPIVLISDADGQPTNDMDKAVSILAGTKEKGWYEFDLAQGSLQSVTYH